MAGPVIIADDGGPPFMEDRRRAPFRIQIGRQSEPMPNLTQAREHDLRLTKISRVHVIQDEQLISMTFNPQRIIVSGANIQFHVKNSGGSIKVHATLRLDEVSKPGFGSV